MRVRRRLFCKSAGTLQKAQPRRGGGVEVPGWSVMGVRALGAGVGGLGANQLRPSGSHPGRTPRGRGDQSWRPEVHKHISPVPTRLGRGQVTPTAPAFRDHVLRDLSGQVGGTRIGPTASKAVPLGRSRARQRPTLQAPTARGGAEPAGRAAPGAVPGEKAGARGGVSQGCSAGDLLSDPPPLLPRGSVHQHVRLLPRVRSGRGLQARQLALSPLRLPALGAVLPGSSLATPTPPQHGEGWPCPFSEGEPWAGCVFVFWLERADF